VVSLRENTSVEEVWQVLPVLLSVSEKSKSSFWWCLIWLIYPSFCVWLGPNSSLNNVRQAYHILLAVSDKANLSFLWILTSHTCISRLYPTSCAPPSPPSSCWRCSGPGWQSRYVAPVLTNEDTIGSFQTVRVEWAVSGMRRHFHLFDQSQEHDDNFHYCGHF
jgi:hypothetical protein